MSQRYEPKSVFGGMIHELEETVIALLLGLMTLVTFANVVVRYGFNSALAQWFEGVTGIDLPGTILWGLEVTLVLFAWLVLFGVAYGFKVTANLGVDAVTNLFEAPVRRVLALISGAICIVYAFLLLKGAWDYWAPFAGLDATAGRWFPIGFDPETGWPILFEDSRDRAWYETEQIPIPDWLRFIEPMFNQGEEYEKLPRFIPYAMLPFACRADALADRADRGRRLARANSASMIVSHEAEEAVEDAATGSCN